MSDILAVGYWNYEAYCTFDDGVRVGRSSRANFFQHSSVHAKILTFLRHYETESYNPMTGVLDRISAHHCAVIKAAE